MTKISIVMPVYNSEQHLKNCISCISEQTFKDFELICVDDGSTDNSAKILEEIAANVTFPMKIIHQNNQGAGVARNNGFKEATGETTIFLDSDDYFKPEFLEEMYAQYTKTLADIVICQYDVVLPDGKFLTRKQGFKKFMIPEKEIFCYEDCPQYIFNFANHAPWNKLYRTTFIKENHLEFDNIPNSNDTFFTLSSLISAKKITTVEKVLIIYNFMNENSITLKRKKNKIYAIQTFQKLKDFLLEHGKMNEKTEQSFNNAYIDCIFYVFNHISKEDRKPLLKFIKENIPLYKKDYIYNRIFYYRLLIIKTTPDWFYILLYKMKCNVRKVKALLKND